MGITNTLISSVFYSFVCTVYNQDSSQDAEAHKKHYFSAVNDILFCVYETTYHGSKGRNYANTAQTSHLLYAMKLYFHILNQLN